VTLLVYPLSFLNRDEIKQQPVIEMLAYGTHNQPAGTFSDDASLTFCLAEALTKDFNLQEVANNFAKWYYEGYWSAQGEVFDVGIATRAAIERISRGIEPEFAGGFEISSNGNGSLMRILPLVFYIKDMSVEDRYRITKQVSSITHAHVRSVIACFYYLEYARLLLCGNDIREIYGQLQIEISNLLIAREINPNEIKIFDRLLKGEIYKLPADEIQSSGYVIHSLEASIWCLMTTESYEDAVLKAVNLGNDTDTTGAVTGGLAALLYGFDAIPDEWLRVLARREDVEDLAVRMSRQLLNPYDFRATLVYKTVEEGGRTTPAKSGYRPAIKFHFDKMLTSGMQYFVDKEWVYPGESAEADINILASPYFEGCLYEGLEFMFTEGTRIIGTGTITKIINEKLRKL
jgi:ADP-ribosyl-[dinitrogen reductase] hydrolase